MRHELEQSILYHENMAQLAETSAIRCESQNVSLKGEFVRLAKTHREAAKLFRNELIWSL